MECAGPEILTLLTRRTIVPTSLSIAVEPSVPDVKASEDVCSDAGNQNCLPLYWTLWKMKGLADDCPVRIDPRDIVPRPCRNRPGITWPSSVMYPQVEIIPPLSRQCTVKARTPQLPDSTNQLKTSTYLSFFARNPARHSSCRIINNHQILRQCPPFNFDPSWESTMGGHYLYYFADKRDTNVLPEGLGRVDF